jgi:hypothetical protein
MVVGKNRIGMKEPMPIRFSPKERQPQRILRVPDDYLESKAWVIPVLKLKYNIPSRVQQPSRSGRVDHAIPRIWPKQKLEPSVRSTNRIEHLSREFLVCPVHDQATRWAPGF